MAPSSEPIRALAAQRRLASRSVAAASSGSQLRPEALTRRSAGSVDAFAPDDASGYGREQHA